jgi:hypothetical protein
MQERSRGDEDLQGLDAYEYASLINHTMHP